jgi:hypothetical protein
VNPDLATSGTSSQETDANGRTPNTANLPRPTTQQRSPAIEPTPPTTADLEALSRASDRYTHGQAPVSPVVRGRRANHSPKRHKTSSVALAMFIALLVGTGVFFTGRFQYRTTATFILPSAMPLADHESFRKELLDHVWHALNASDISVGGKPETGGTHESVNLSPTLARRNLAAAHSTSSLRNNEVTRWHLDTPQPGALRVSLVTQNPDRANQLLGALAANFVNQQRTAATAKRLSPTETEHWLTEYAARLRTELADAETQVNAAIAALPTEDPNEQQKALLDRWHSVRSRFDSTRGELTDASTSLARLREQPEPTHGIVPAHERQTELEADDALQADLSELAVNLAEVKRHLLNIADQSQSPLQQLHVASQSLHDVLASLDRSGLSQPMRDALDRLTRESNPYRQSLQAFAGNWDRSMKTLVERDIDPLSSEILDIHRECADRINEFLFASARHLTTMRTHVATLGQTASDNARHHVLQSDIARAFQQLQTAHHRFEFSAGRLAGADNFRLDAARRSALGLRHRTQTRIREIDRRLQEQAVQRARAQREQDLAAAEEMVKRIRAATDRTVDDLVILQERLNAAVADSEAFHSAMRGLDLAMGRLEATRKYLRETEVRLEGLETVRLAAQDDFDLTFYIDNAASGPINIHDLLRSGLIAAGLVFFTAMLGQWWIGRRTLAL